MIPADSSRALAFCSATLTPEPFADLRKSGLSDTTIRTSPPYLNATEYDRQLLLFEELSVGVIDFVVTNPPYVDKRELNDAPIEPAHMRAAAVDQKRTNVPLGVRLG